MSGRRILGSDACDRVLRDGGRSADLSDQADQADRAVHAGLAGRCAGARRHPAPVGRLGQPIVIDNRPGAGTTIGTKLAASADPDGYTLLIGATSFIMSFSLYPNLDFDPLKSFAPVSMLADSPQVMVIAPSVPARTVQEFIAYAKANPGKLNFGFGLGTLPQILGESFKASPAPTSSTCPTKAARRRSPICWAAASR